MNEWAIPGAVGRVGNCAGCGLGVGNVGVCPGAEAGEPSLDGGEVGSVCGAGTVADAGGAGGKGREGGMGAEALVVDVCSGGGRGRWDTGAVGVVERAAQGGAGGERGEGDEGRFCGIVSEGKSIGSLERETYPWLGELELSVRWLIE